LKSGRARAIRFSTLEEICNVWECQAGDILAIYEREGIQEIKELVDMIRQSVLRPVLLLLSNAMAGTIISL
jgi:hypothetical protein